MGRILWMKKQNEQINRLKIIMARLKSGNSHIESPLLSAMLKNTVLVDKTLVENFFKK